MKKTKRIMSAVMALLLLASLPAAAFAETYYIDQGSITVSADTAGQYVTQPGVADNAPQTGETIITQNDSSVQTSNTVTISAGAGATAEVTLDGVNIDTSGSGNAAVSTAGAGDVTVELDNTNTIKSGNGHAGLEKNNTGELTVTDSDNDNGSLSATGGQSGAGIGGGSGSDGSKINIEGGTIDATGGIGSAGIGGGGFGGSGSDITINGGEVTATGGQQGAGIGGGSGGDGNNITINDGKVTAAGGQQGGSGIGGGAGSVRYSDDGSKVTITGGNGNDINITGGKVTATGGGAGIGILSGSGIGGGMYGEGNDIAVSNSAQLKVQGGAQTYVNVWTGTGAGIGSGADFGENYEPMDGIEIEPDISTLSIEGRIYYYAPNANIDTDKPIKIVHGGECIPETDKAVAATCTSVGFTEGSHCSICGKVLKAQEIIPMLGNSADTQSIPLYRATDKDGRDIVYKAERKNGVLTITMDMDFAVLTGTLSGIRTLMAQGVETIVFVTKNAVSTFALADLTSKGGSGSYALTHDGATVTFVLTDTDISDILK